MNNDKFHPKRSAGRAMAQRSSLGVEAGSDAANQGDASRKKFPWALHTLWRQYVKTKISEVKDIKKEKIKN